MMEQITAGILYSTLIYISGGLLFLIYFLTKGIYILDEGAKGSTFIFKLLISFGVVIFWAFLLKTILKKKNKI